MSHSDEPDSLLSGEVHTDMSDRADWSSPLRPKAAEWMTDLPFMTDGNGEVKEACCGEPGLSVTLNSPTIVSGFVTSLESLSLDESLRL